MSNFAVGTEAFANVREIAFGRCRVRPAERKLLVDGCAVRLGGRAFELLLALIERRDRTASKNELLDVVWPGLVVEENNLQTQISALRKLLGPDVIVTIPGRGVSVCRRAPRHTCGHADATDDAAAGAHACPRPLRQSLDRGSALPQPESAMPTRNTSPTASARTSSRPCRAFMSSWLSRAVPASASRARVWIIGRSRSNSVSSTC